METKIVLPTGQEFTVYTVISLDQALQSSNAMYVHPEHIIYFGPTVSNRGHLASAPQLPDFYQAARDTSPRLQRPWRLVEVRQLRPWNNPGTLSIEKTILAFLLSNGKAIVETQDGSVLQGPDGIRVSLDGEFTVIKGKLDHFSRLTLIGRPFFGVIEDNDNIWIPQGPTHNRDGRTWYKVPDGRALFQDENGQVHIDVIDYSEL